MERGRAGNGFIAEADKQPLPLPFLSSSFGIPLNFMKQLNWDFFFPISHSFQTFPVTVALVNNPEFIPISQPNKMFFLGTGASGLGNFTLKSTCFN